MQPWQINLIVVLGVILIGVFTPAPFGKDLVTVIVLGSALWVYLDAKKLEISKYKATGLAPSSSPSGAAAITGLLWIVGFPLYVSYRQKIIDGKVPLKNSPVAKPISEVKKPT